MEYQLPRAVMGVEKEEVRGREGGREGEGGGKEGRGEGGDQQAFVYRGQSLSKALADAGTLLRANLL